MTNNDELAFIAKAALKAGQGSKEMVEFRVTANPANILALLAERYADKKRIAELNDTLERECEKSRRMASRIAELESRTVSVPTFEEWCQMEDMKPLGWVREAMKEAYDGCRAAAGIKLEVGE